MRKVYATLLFLLLTGMGLMAQIQMPLPAHNAQFTGSVRGYYFTSPSCFTITGLQVPVEAGGGSQNIAVVRFQAIPPFYSATTNNFSVLYLTQNNPNTGILPVNIQVEQGDIIGVLGQAGTINSYATAGFASTINGLPVTLNRLGMQFSLSAFAPQSLWTETGGSISRVWIYYDSTLTFNVTATPTGISSYDFVSNADTSFGIAWNYGDGSPVDVSDMGSHTYSAGGTYNVCSYITTSCGTDTICTTVTICGPDPVSDFTSTSAGFSVAFQDSSSNATTWEWNFGDGGSSTNANPTHTYANVGWYNVCLVTSNACGAMDTLCDSVLVCVAPVASFTHQLVGRDSVDFGDMSTNATNWSWSFGDGQTSNAQNPQHIYTADGTYNVCLIVDNLCGVDTICDSITICVTVLVADFTATINESDLTLTNNSAGATSYLWDFGDGNTSTAMTPTHTYANNGTYAVCLTVTNNCQESETVCDTVVIAVLAMEQVLPGFEISVSPNPTSDLALVKVINPSVQGSYTFELLDLRGALILKKEATFNTALVLESRTLAKGMYVYRVVQEGNRIGSGKLIIE